MPGLKREGLRLNKKTKLYGLLALAILLMFLLLPIPGYTPEYSRAFYSAEGDLLSAITSREEQWCFPLEDDNIPEKFRHCLILYEDEFFYKHPGINPVSILKAAYQNIKERKIVRGGSTIQMQVMRMRNRHVERSFKHKIIESLSALKYNLMYSRSEILKEWSEVAPFGGNTIGLRAASLRYFGKEPEALSWSAYALLAVLPNNPGRINVSKNRLLLKEKRNNLLVKLHSRGHFSESDLDVYMDEDLPVELFDIPQSAYHLLKFTSDAYKDKPIVHSTVSTPVQQKLNKLLEEEAAFLRIEDIGNIAAIIIDIRNNCLLAYTGNVRQMNGRYDYVDAGRSLRSYGSLLKPFLYAEALESGTYLPNELVPDIPTAIGDFRPKNFDQKFRGAAALGDMVTQSLNVPAVRVLNKVGLQQFYYRLKQLQLEGLTKSVDHYGLSLILGGGESTLWDLSRLYKGLAQSRLGHSQPFAKFKVLSEDTITQGPDFNYRPQVITYTTDVMKDVTRPREEKSWTLFSSAKSIAWKTGTSYGHRDAWAIGFNDHFLVGVWTGNVNGEGRHGLTGISKAAPIMFKIFNGLHAQKLPSQTPTYTASQRISVCKSSGKLAGLHCKDRSIIHIDHLSHKYETCNYHTVVYLDEDNQQVSDACQELIVKKDTLFTLPPVMSYYYQKAALSYSGMPPVNSSCPPGHRQIQPIYPENGLKIFLPRDAKDRKNQLIAQAYHIDKESVVYWYFNDRNLCVTEGGNHHECTVDLDSGQYDLVLIDQNGHKVNIVFEIL